MALHSIKGVFATGGVGNIYIFREQAFLFRLFFLSPLTLQAPLPLFSSVGVNKIVGGDRDFGLRSQLTPVNFHRELRPSIASKGKRTRGQNFTQIARRAGASTRQGARDRIASSLTACSLVEGVVLAVR